MNSIHSSFSSNDGNNYDHREGEKNSNNNNNNNNNNNFKHVDSANDEMSLTKPRTTTASYNHHHMMWLSVLSNTIFVIASCLYLALTTIVLDEYRFYKDVPAAVVNADDDASWWNYYNTTNAFDDVVMNATDDTVWSEWFNNSFFQDGTDRTVFQVHPQKETTAVTTYMMLYFLAAMGFLLTGMIEFWVAMADGRRVRQGLYLIFILAALFGVASSMMVVASPYLASVFNAVSVHLFAIEAISIVIQSRRRSDDGMLLLTGQISFVVGTVIDVVLSYFFVFDLATLPHVRAAVAAACFWLLCSLIYLWDSVSSTSCESRRSSRSNSDDDNVAADDTKKQKSLETRNTGSEEEEA